MSKTVTRLLKKTILSDGVAITTSARALDKGSSSENKIRKVRANLQRRFRLRSRWVVRLSLTIVHICREAWST